jgi:hypothetical protein
LTSLIVDNVDSEQIIMAGVLSEAETAYHLRQSKMDNEMTLATLGTQNRGGRQAKHKSTTQNRKSEKHEPLKKSGMNPVGRKW